MWFVFKPRSPKGRSWGKGSGRKGAAHFFFSQWHIPVCALLKLFFFIRAWPQLCLGQECVPSLAVIKDNWAHGEGRSEPGWRLLPHSHFALPSGQAARGFQPGSAVCQLSAVTIWLLGTTFTVLWLNVALCCLGFCSLCSASERFCQDRNSSFRSPALVSVRVGGGCPRVNPSVNSAQIHE